ncbi:natterin-3-like [Sphaeramia orbicularis]|uniref:Natterin-3-like n=1 Tax=Sphaeramia orbicularis TaxID=375764 RepID=A0A672Z188_9TELE|nr:natterin-3-like [Sphaeramia orbicularis]
MDLLIVPVLLLALLSSASVRPAMASDYIQFHRTSLQWQTWTGTIPNGAVAAYIENQNRYEYVAKYEHEIGFYCPTLDHYCHYAAGGREHRRSSFEILVNKDNFELLEWKPGSYGSVPENAVKSVPDLDIYVAKTRFGLGKVHARHEAFFHPYDGSEHWHKHYDILTFSRDIIKEEIHDLIYHTNGVHVLKNPPEILATTRVSNNNVTPAKQTSQLSNTVEEQESWSTSSTLTVGFSLSVTARIPLFASTTIGFSEERSFTVTEGSTKKKSTTHAVSIEHEVPPHHSCSVQMVAYKYSANIPFTGRLQRTYRQGQKGWTSITGTYKGVQVAEVQAVVDGCTPLSRDL